MGMLDGVLSQIGGAEKVAQLAGQFGLSEAQVKSAMSALGQASGEPGDTVTSAAQATGLPAEKMQGLLGAVGGESIFSQFTGSLDKDGDGQIMDDVVDMAKGLFGGKQ
jgi:hypothetical protein